MMNFNIMNMRQMKRPRAAIYGVINYLPNENSYSYVIPIIVGKFSSNFFSSVTCDS